MFVLGGMIAVLDASIPAFIGRTVTLVSGHEPATLLHDAWPQFAFMAGVLLLARPVVFLSYVVLINQIVNPGLSNMIRWQNHWHVVRQSWTFFQNDFAGRIANRVMQTGPALRESLVMTFDAGWYIVVYGSSAAAAAGVDRLAPDAARSCCGSPATPRCFALLRAPHARTVPRACRRCGRNLTGRVVDSYTNILTVKLFARAQRRGRLGARGGGRAHRRLPRPDAHDHRLHMTLALMNALLVVGTAAIAIWQWSDGRIAVGAVATALPLAWQLTNIAGWVARSVTAIFENIGTVQDGMRSIAVRAADAGPRRMPCELRVTGGEIRFEHVHFDYGRAAPDARGGWRCCTAST